MRAVVDMSMRVGFGYDVHPSRRGEKVNFRW